MGERRSFQLTVGLAEENFRGTVESALDVGGGKCDPG